MTEKLLKNARLILADSVLEGAVLIRDGAIADISDGAVAMPGGEDLDGDYVLPGLVELHTDALEAHMSPRPGADWPGVSAVIAHDNQLAASGITTVLDALAVGAIFEDSMRIQHLERMIDSIATARQEGLLRADHMLHLRCELTYRDLPELVEGFIDHPIVRMVSLMDHTPGQRQFVDEGTYRLYYQKKFSMEGSMMDDFIAKRKAEQVEFGDKHRRIVVEASRDRGITLASHDDATAAHVSEAVADGVRIAEFPTTVEAAKASHGNGISVMMGGPNVVRGGSHSGNVSARELAEKGYLDIISSDYVPTSLLHSAFLLAEKIEGMDLPKAVQTVTKTPAEGVGLTDRGEIAVGKRADLIRVEYTPHHPLVRGAWREGRRVA